MKLTYGDAKATVAQEVSLNADNARVLRYCNQAQEELLYRGYWKDTHVRYNVCVSDSCLTWPRDIETIEAASMCGCNLTIRNSWYEFLENGPGTICGDSGLAGQLVDRGNSVAFDDVSTTGCKLAIYADGSETAGSTLLVRYYNQYAQKVYTTWNGETIEGERIAIPSAGNYSYSTYEVMRYGLYEVIKPVTNYPIRLYQYAVSGGAIKPLAYYEPDETLPDYRRSIVPNYGGGTSTDGSCESAKLTIAGKRRFIPAINDDSILMISHLRALKLAVKAVFMEEANQEEKALRFWMLAKDALDAQLKHHQGTGVVAPLRMVYADGRGEGVLNIV